MLICSFALCGSLCAQTPETIGRIEGDAFSAKGQVQVTSEAGGKVATLLSGSEVTVHSGYARLVLVDGSEIDICGPAQFSLLKSGGAITLALSHGRIHARIAADLPLTIYTALVVAAPVSVSGKPRDTVVGLDADGTMCVLATHGALRLEQQLTGQKLLVPQNGELFFTGGQLESVREAAGSCRCDVPVARAEPPASKPPQVGVAADAESAEANKTTEKKPEPRPATEQPTFTAIMPPLTFDASAPLVPQRAAPSEVVILLVREVRVRPAAVFTGRVEPRAKPAKPGVVQSSADSPSATPTNVAAREGFGNKLKNFFRRLFGRKTKT